MEKQSENSDLEMKLFALSLFIGAASTYLLYGDYDLGKYRPYVENGAKWGWGMAIFFILAPAIWKYRWEALSFTGTLLRKAIQKLSRINVRQSFPVIQPSNENLERKSFSLLQKEKPFELGQGMADLSVPVNYLPQHDGKHQYRDALDQMNYEKELTIAFQRVGLLKSDESLNVKKVQQGPLAVKVTIDIPAGVKMSQIKGNTEDLETMLGIPSLQVVNGEFTASAALVMVRPQRPPILLRSCIEKGVDQFQKYALPIVIGVGLDGQPVVVDLVSVRNLLVAGTTGSGKSWWLNQAILGLLMAKTPDELQMVLIDPKMVELASFSDYPHVMKVVTEPKKSAQILKLLVGEMEKRYELLRKYRMKNIQQLLKRRASDKDIPPMPYIICVVDELADLMIVAKNEIEPLIQRLTQKARAAGIFLILATQRPSVDVVTGVIKSNMPSRVVFRCMTSADYSTVLGFSPGTTLLGKGDGVALIEGSFDLIRFQSPGIATDEDMAEETIQQVSGYLNQKYGHARVEHDLIGVGLEEDLDYTDLDDEEILDLEEGDDDVGEEKKLLKVLKSYIAYNEEVRVSDIQQFLGIRKQRVIHLLQMLVQEGWLEAPPEGNPRAGYQLLLTKEQIENYKRENPLHI
ncbi:MAG: DNA translocase FtsK [Bacillaceae bacterium]|nr:DNA translocase FtsK [Bacillaceae bacterium]